MKTEKLEFELPKLEMQTFRRIKKELGFRNDEQVLRRLMYDFDDRKWRGEQGARNHPLGLMSKEEEDDLDELFDRRQEAGL